jgi:hypothetical protein
VDIAHLLLRFLAKTPVASYAQNVEHMHDFLVNGRTETILSLY